MDQSLLSIDRSVQKPGGLQERCDDAVDGNVSPSQGGQAQVVDKESFPGS